MISIQDKALLHLFGTTNLGTVKEDSLLDLASKYPYFAPIQLLLAVKLKQNNSTSFTGQAQKTNLYFNNPYWVHFLLSNNALTNTLVKTIAPVNETNNPSVASTGVSPSPSEGSVAAETVAYNHQPYEEATATVESNTKIANLLSEQLADFKKPISEQDKLEINREPLYTTDYFASQGIKIDLSQIPQDKLTTQLLRFTDWLKYMKSDNSNPIDLETRKDLEEVVVLNAQNSNEQKEILTESMAKIFQKQGQIDKAIQLYLKLSFINPEKSAYFATKIQQLKGI